MTWNTKGAIYTRFQVTFTKEFSQWKLSGCQDANPKLDPSLLLMNFQRTLTHFLIGISSFALSHQPANQSVWWLCSTNGMASECGVSGRHGWNLVPFIQGHFIGSRLWTEAVSFFFFQIMNNFYFYFQKKDEESRVPASKGAFVVLKNMYLPRRGLKCLHITLLT